MLRLCAPDISARLHAGVVAHLNKNTPDRITHIAANALNPGLPKDRADMVVSTFGLKTFNRDRQTRQAQQIAHCLKPPGGHFALIEASDPKKWERNRGCATSVAAYKPLLPAQA